MKMKALQLPDTTLIASTSIDHIATLLALKHTSDLIQFRNVIYFSDEDPYELYSELVNSIDNFLYLPIKKSNNYQEVCIFYLCEMPKYTHLYGSTSMMIHWDGYPLRLSAWSPEFLTYSFIGSPWDWGGVGNNGFCIQSKQFFKAIKSLSLKPTVHDCHPCDMVLFRHHQKFIDEFGIKIAPFEVAKRFAVEGHRYDEVGSFGYHGIYNLVGADIPYPDIVVPDHHKHYLTKFDLPHRYSPKRTNPIVSL